MLLKELVISICHSAVNPSLGCLVGVNAYICLGVVEVGVEIDFVVGVGCDVEIYLVSCNDLDAAVAVCYSSAFGFGMYS